jgi:thioredoxin-related protein
MKKTAILILMLVTLTLSAFDIEKLPKYSTEYDKKVNPYKSLAVAMKKAKVSNKKILLLVGGNWCKWCGTLDNFLEDNEEIGKSFYGSFEVVRVYYGKGINKEAKSLLKQFPPLKATPHFYILDKNAKLLKSLGSANLERGYGYNRKKVVKFIKDNK